MKTKLKTISQENLQNDESIQEKQKIYETKIKTAQYEISLMRKQWKKEQDRLKSTENENEKESGSGSGYEPPNSPHIGNSNDLLEVIFELLMTLHLQPIKLKYRN